MMKRQVAVWGVVSLLCVYPLGSRAQQSCDDFNECTGNGMCMPDGNCSEGAPLPDGTPCSKPTSSCLTAPTCLDGLCNGGTPMDDGTPCRLFDSECFTEGTCLTVDLPTGGRLTGCFGSLPITDACDDNDPCTEDFCNPLGAGCGHFPKCFTYECAVSSCNPASGECTTTPRNDGMRCDVGLECGGERVCSGGDCIEGIAVATATPTTSLATPTPTMLVATPTPTTPIQGCIGDCNETGEVTIDDIVVMIGISESGASASECLNGDANGDTEISVDDALQAVNVAFDGC